MNHSPQNPDPLQGETDARPWFCVRAQPKHEHIAAAHLRQSLAIDVFLPKIRFKRLTRTGTAWVTEALFLNYFFARFDLATSLRRVKHARGVESVVHFGSYWPEIPEPVMMELRATVGDKELRVISETFNPGDPVVIADGALHGLQALVSKVMPGKQRVAVLLDFLGRQTTVELADNQLLAASVPYRI